MLQIANPNELNPVQTVHAQHGPPGRMRTHVELMEPVTVFVIAKKMALKVMNAPAKVPKSFNVLRKNVLTLFVTAPSVVTRTVQRMAFAQVRFTLHGFILDNTILF